MTIFQDINHQPNEKVAQILSKSPNIDPRLPNLWSIIGKHVFCLNKTDVDEVCRLLTTDPIAYPLMQQIINIDKNVEYAVISKIYGSNSTPKKLSDFKKMLLFPDATLVLSSKSDYAAIITKNSFHSLGLEIWNLKTTNLLD